VAIDTPENLKLEHGSRSATIRIRSENGVEERSIPLGAANTGELLKAAGDDKNLMTIHTEEATLEDIFVQITGRGLV
jgi:hypothetical protein